MRNLLKPVYALHQVLILGSIELCTHTFHETHVGNYSVTYSYVHTCYTMVITLIIACRVKVTESTRGGHTLLSLIHI